MEWGICMDKTLSSRVIGYVASLILTFTAFLLITHPAFFPLEMPMIITALIGLAVCQAMAQLIFFLHVLQEKKPRFHLIIFVSTISIILVILLFSIWIMHHLNYNMMPQHVQ